MFLRIFLITLAVSLDARDGAARYPLSGQIVARSAALDHLRVDAVSSESHPAEATAWVSSDGAFELRSLAAGTYVVRVTTRSGEVVATVTCSVPAAFPPQIEIQTAGASAPAGPVSVYRLSHRVPGKALKAWRKATAELKQGKPKSAAGYFDKAIEADPEFADALHMRGLYAVQTDDLAKARALLDKAAGLDNANPTFLADAAVAGYAANAFADAERYSRSALRLDPALKRAHYVLGLSLLRLGRAREQALEALKVAAPAYLKAAELVARLSSAQ